MHLSEFPSYSGITCHKWLEFPHKGTTQQQINVVSSVLQNNLKDLCLAPGFILAVHEEKKIQKIFHYRMLRSYYKNANVCCK